jgi:hypothetical protein
MKTSEAKENIFASLIAMQSEMTNIAKDSKGYGYSYTSLEKLIDHIRPIASKHDIGFFQTTTSSENGEVGVTTRVIHKSGEWVEDTMTAPLTKLAKMNEYQVAGSVITYFRRYALSAMFGIASDEDIDVQGEVTRIDNKQAGIINNLVVESGTDLSMFCSAYKIENLMQLPQISFQKAVSQLQAKIKKANK